MSRSQSKAKERAAQAAVVTPTYDVWPNAFPPDPPTVQIIFHGLLLFFFNHRDGCQVGVHNATHRNILLPRHPQPHDLVINVVTIPSDGSPILQNPIRIGKPQDGGEIIINVTRPQIVDGTYVYAPGAFDRLTATDNKDWRWVLDFEGPDLYNTSLTKAPLKFTPRVRINNGLFHTFLRTKSRFETRLSNGTRVKDLGHIALLTAANIYLDAGGNVSLTIGGAHIPPPIVGGLPFTYQVHIFNDCRSSEAGCKFEIDHPTDKTKRNDFYLYHDLFDPPPNPELELFCYDPKTLTSVSAEIQEAGLFAADTTLSLTPFLIDSAPCAPGGAGGDPGPG